MEQLLTDLMVSGVTPETLIGLLVVVLSIAVLMKVKNLLQDWMAYRRLKSCDFLSKGSWVRVGTANGYMSCFVEDFDMKRITLNCDDEGVKVYKSVRDFVNQDWVMEYRQDG